jgi:protein-L-isoaspartate(D-aspartate) O-methyltransferase
MANAQQEKPYIVALMLEAAEIGPGDRVLEVGAGSGYAAAVAAQLAAEVCAVERHASLVAQAQRRFDKLGFRNISLRHGDGTKGWPDGGACRQPFKAAAVRGYATQAYCVARRLVLAWSNAPTGTQITWAVAVRTRQDFGY